MEKFRRENREHIQELFEARTGVVLNRKGGKFRRVRMAAAAACVCAALLGAVYAAEVASVVRISFFEEGEFADEVLSGYRVVVDPQYIPLDQLSENVQKLSKEYEGARYNPPAKLFESWSDAEEFIGLELMDNPVLDQISKYFVKTREIDGKRVEEYEYHCCVSFNRYSSLEITDMRVIANYLWYGTPESGVFHSVDLKLTAVIRTEETETYDGVEYMAGFDPERWDVGIEEVYTTPSGLETTIVSQTYKSSDGHQLYWYRADFVMNDILFTLEAQLSDWPRDGEPPKDPEVALTVLKEVLDGFS